MYSHAKFQMKTKLEKQIALRKQAQVCKVSKSKGEMIGNRLYQEHVMREKRHKAHVIANSVKDQSKREISKVTMKSH